MDNNRGNLLVVWAKWQFNEVPNFLLGVWNNYIMFASNYFSLPILFKTFFSPWRKYRWRYPKSWDVKEFFNTLISNLFSRVIGAVMRLFLIVFGILFQIFILLAGSVMFLLWLFMPIIIIAGLLFVLIYQF